MVGEKIGAGLEAFSGLMAGSHPLAVIDRYREHVAANMTRLGTPKPRPVSEQELVGILQARTGMSPNYAEVSCDTELSLTSGSLSTTYQT
jgi:hypothetical protein